MYKILHRLLPGRAYVTLRNMMRALVPGSLYVWFRDRFVKPDKTADVIYDLHAQEAIRACVQPGDVVFDVGANVGILSRVLSKQVGANGQVYAFEPHPEVAADLRLNVSPKAYQNVRVIQAAAFEVSGLVKPFYSDDRPNLGHMASSLKVEWLGDVHAPRAFSVPTLALDDFCAQRQLQPRFVKIDVEGLEAAVLKGFSQQLQTSKPALLLETGGSTPENNVAAYLLEEWGYRLAVPGPWRWITAHDLAARLELETSVVAIHRDQLAQADWIGKSS